MTTHRVAAVQAEPVWMDIDGTTARTIELIDEAGAAGVELLAFPETWIPGYPVFLWSLPVYEQAPWVARYHANSPTANGEHLARIRAAAKRHGITVVIGFAERDAGSLYMAQQIIGPDGEVLLHRRKLKPTHAERTLFGESDGSGIKVVDSAVGRLGALNCFEHLQPLTKFAMYAQQEQVHVAGWPCPSILGMHPMLTPDALVAATKVYALEGGTFTLLTCQVMSEEGAKAFPGSDGGVCPVYTGGGGIARIFGPDSAELTEPLGAGTEGFVVADIDLASIALAKNVVDPAGHYSRSDVTRLLLDTSARTPMVTYGDDTPGPEVAVEDEEAPAC